MAKEKILVVDDVETIRKLITAHLAKEGYTVIAAGDGKSALELVRAENPDLILLDIILPDMDGLELCQELRKEKNTPVIFLTAKDEITDIVLGLGIGGDDYITKPFNPAEMLARVKAHLRRNKLVNTPGEKGEVLSCPPLEIDLDSHSVSVEGKTINLTLTEFSLLSYLARNPNKVIRSRQLYENAWQDMDFFDDSTLKVHISNLRKKIEPDPANPTFILTVRGIGYKFNG